MDANLLEKAKELASRPYPFRVYKDATSDRDILYLAKNPDLEGCMAQGSSQRDVLKNLAEARIDYISFLLERGLSVPEPSEIAPSSVGLSSQSTLRISGLK